MNGCYSDQNERFRHAVTGGPPTLLHLPCRLPKTSLGTIGDPELPASEEGNAGSPIVTTPVVRISNDSPSGCREHHGAYNAGVEIELSSFYVTRTLHEILAWIVYSLLGE
jgi:hypothetical protein